MAITIRGQAGKTMDFTARSWETLRIAGDQLRFSTLDDDFFAYTSIADDAAGTGALLPEIGQIVEVYDGIARKFKGVVTAVTPGQNSISVRADGPWWWMKKINLSGDFAPPFDAAYGAGGTAATRHNYAFPQQALRTSLNAMIDRAIALGVPMARGSIDTMFTVTPITLPNMSCAAALAEMLRFCPDSVVWFNYGVEPPTINISRRGAMIAGTYTIGAHVFEGLENIRPRTDLKLSRAEVHYVDRHPTTGAPRWQSQVSGTAVAGEIQITTVSGPELLTYLPKDKLESVSVKSTNSLTAAFVANRDGTLSGLKEQWGVIGAPSSQITLWYDSGNTRYASTTVFPGQVAKNKSGTVVSTVGKYFLTSSAQLPDWAIELLGATEVTLTGSWIGTINTGSNWSDAWIAWHDGTRQGFGWSSSTTTTATTYWFMRPWSINVWMIDTEYAVTTTLYKPPEYGYTAPPASLAANFLACQNWVPWEGSFTLVEDSLGLDNLLLYTVNIAGTLPACATMEAMVRSVTYSVKRGRRTFELAAPTRTQLGTLVNRVRQSPEDQTYWL